MGPLCSGGAPPRTVLLRIQNNEPAMFAIIEDGSHQYRVEPGQTLDLDYRSRAQKGETISFDRVLLASDGSESAIGRPVVEGAVVQAEVLNPQTKGKKLEIQHLRRRKNSRRHTGHRQKYTSVRITRIEAPGLEPGELATAGEQARASAPAAAETETEREAPAEE